MIVDEPNDESKHESNNVKCILLNINETTSKKRIERKRIITTTKKWDFTQEQLNNQVEIILNLYNLILSQQTNFTSHENFIPSLIFILFIYI